MLIVYGGGDGRSDLILVPFAPYQLATTALPPEYEPVMFRRFVRMVAERIAGDVGCLAISCGDNLAQVASQTLQNLLCIDRGSDLPTLRPVLTYDKEEIVQLAKQIETYEVSLKPYKDCCSIVSRHPRTRMRVEEVDEACNYFKFEELARQCIPQAELVAVTGETVDARPLSELVTKRENRSGSRQRGTSSTDRLDAESFDTDDPEVEPREIL